MHRVIPALGSELHKGQCGKVAVFGGGRLYTGAPFFAAQASLRAGGDLAHVFCDAGAADTIRGFSPELMVHPLALSEHEDCAAPRQYFAGQAHRLSALVLGCGLGRDPHAVRTVLGVMQEATAKSLPLVVDGDGLWVLAQEPWTEKFMEIGDWPWTVLTPNVNEFRNLVEAVTRVTGDKKWMADGENATVRDLSSALKVTVLLKGAVDVIALPCGKVVECDVPGGLRRCGGQGDVLAGALGTFLSWAKARSQEQGAEGEGHQEEGPEEGVFWTELAALGAASLTRTASRLAYAQRKRATLTTDILDHIGPAFESLFPESVP